MSVLTYNGISFGPDSWQTLSFNQEALADGSYTETECVRIVITGEILLTEPYDNMAGASAVSSYRTLSGGFMERRKRLSFKVNGREMIPSASIDCKNGPIPNYFNVIQLNAGAALCQLKITSHWAEATGNNEAGKILSHRWKESASIDVNLLTAKTRIGKLVVSSSEYNGDGTGQLDADLRHTLVTTSVPKGFLRTSAEYTIHENGLEMTYTIKDVEQFRMPPNPATTAEGGFTAMAQKLGKPGRRCEARYTLRGPKDAKADPADMCRQALGICFSKCRANGGFFPEKAVFAENSYRNEVTVTLTGHNKPILVKDAAKFFSLLMARRSVGLPPKGSEPGAAVAARPVYGTANVLLHAAAYHDPTLAQTLNKQNNQVRPTDGGIPGG